MDSLDGICYKLQMFDIVIDDQVISLQKLVSCYQFPGFKVSFEEEAECNCLPSFSGSDGSTSDQCGKRGWSNQFGGSLNEVSIWR